MFITEAHAQAAEATKAAEQAASVYLDRGVLGATCIFLLIAVGVLFWLLIRSYGRHGEIAERVVAGLGASTTATQGFAAAMERMQAAQATAADALREQSQETANEIREARHAVQNHQAGVNAVVELLVRRERGSA